MKMVVQRGVGFEVVYYLLFRNHKVDLFALNVHRLHKIYFLNHFKKVIHVLFILHYCLKIVYPKRFFQQNLIQLR